MGHLRSNLWIERERAGSLEGKQDELNKTYHLEMEKIDTIYKDYLNNIISIYVPYT